MRTHWYCGRCRAELPLLDGAFCAGMASSSRTLVAAHASSITANDLQAFTLESERAEPLNHVDSDFLPEHATETSVLCDPQAHILLRVIQDRRTIELISLSSEISPIRFIFPAPVLPSPAVVYDNDEVHVIACTTAGSVFRLVFPLPDLWNTQYMAKDWREEYHLRHPTSNLLGPVHVKEAGCLFIALKDGNILQLDASRRQGNAEFQGKHGHDPSSLPSHSLMEMFNRMAGAGASATSLSKFEFFHAIHNQATSRRFQHYSVCKRPTPFPIINIVLPPA